jgi:hypothetical protein
MAARERASFTESVVEDTVLAWLESLGYAIKHGPEITRAGDTLTPGSSPGQTLTLSQWERESYSEVILSTRLREALVRLNPTLPMEAIEDAFRKVSRLEGATLDARNRDFIGCSLTVSRWNIETMDRFVARRRDSWISMIWTITNGSQSISSWSSTEEREETAA